MSYLPPSDVKAARAEFGRLLQSVRAPRPPKRWKLLCGRICIFSVLSDVALSERRWPSQQTLGDAYEYEDDDLDVSSLPDETSRLASVAAIPELLAPAEAVWQRYDLE